ncbi:MAG: protein kinase domain-containing protein, partial [Planctomycetota bacterium]
MTEPRVLFERYEVKGLLGRGGAAEVFLVEDTQAGSALRALKLIDLPPGRAGRFERIRGEFEILARYEHPHLARAFEIGRAGDRAFFTMEYIEGANLLET